MRKQADLHFKLKARRAGLPERVSRIDLLCGNTRWWVDAHGNWHDIRHISREYQENLLAYWRGNAKRIKASIARRETFAILFAPPGGYEGPSEAELEERMERVERLRALTPGRWLDRQPLVRALRRELAR